MQLTNGFKLIYERVKETQRKLYASKTSIPEEDNAELDFGVSAEDLADIKLVYEKDGKIMISKTGLPTSDDIATLITADGEVVIDDGGGDPPIPPVEIVPFILGDYTNGIVVNPHGMQDAELAAYLATLPIAEAGGVLPLFGGTIMAVDSLGEGAQFPVNCLGAQFESADGTDKLILFSPEEFVIEVPVSDEEVLTITFKKGWWLYDPQDFAIISEITDVFEFRTNQLYEITDEELFEVFEPVNGKVFGNLFNIAKFKPVKLGQLMACNQLAVDFTAIDEAELTKLILSLEDEVHLFYGKYFDDADGSTAYEIGIADQCLTIIHSNGRVIFSTHPDGFSFEGATLYKGWNVIHLDEEGHPVVEKPTKDIEIMTVLNKPNEYITICYEAAELEDSTIVNKLNGTVFGGVALDKFDLHRITGDAICDIGDSQDGTYSAFVVDLAKMSVENLKELVEDWTKDLDVGGEDTAQIAGYLAAFKPLENVGALVCTYRSNAFYFFTTGFSFKDGDFSFTIPEAGWYSQGHNEGEFIRITAPACYIDRYQHEVDPDEIDYEKYDLIKDAIYGIDSKYKFGFNTDTDKYRIIEKIYHGYYNGPYDIPKDGSMVYGNIIPEEGYTYPNNVELHNASYKYDSQTGEIQIWKASSDVYLNATCVKSQPLDMIGIDDVVTTNAVLKVNTSMSVADINNIISDIPDETILVSYSLAEGAGSSRLYVDSDGGIKIIAFEDLPIYYASQYSYTDKDTEQLVIIPEGWQYTVDIEGTTFNIIDQLDGILDISAVMGQGTLTVSDVDKTYLNWNGFIVGKAK